MPPLPPTTFCAKSKAGIFKSFGWGETGCFNVNTLYDEQTRSFSESPEAFPTILELAQLSQQVYSISDIRAEEKVPFPIDHMTDWICIGTGRYSDGYCGAAYANYKHSHVVIAHGGTEFKITKPVELYRDFIITDVIGVGLNKDVSQISSAYIFTKIIVNLCSDTQFSISVTGHSLGGWLAQISAFYIENPTYITRNEKVQKIIADKQRHLEIPGQYVKTNESCHLHTVSFDSPGCRRALKKIVGYYGSKMVEWRENVDTLDFTVIIAPSNSVNTCEEHVGYLLKLEMDGVQDISWFTASHGIQLFVDHLTIKDSKLKEVHDVYFGKAIKSEDESIILDHWYTGRMLSCQVNIFSNKEIEFLTRAQIIVKWRTSVSIESSDMTIFQENKHKEVRKILKYISDKMLNDFVHDFTLRNNAINFSENRLNEKKMNMSELIRKLIMLFRLNKGWSNTHELQNVIRDLPGCREMVCQSEGTSYIKRLPKLKDGHCITQNVCAQVAAFLQRGSQHFLHIKAGREGRHSRVYMMVHIFNCFRDHYDDEVGEHILFMNISILQRLSMEIRMAEIFSQTKLGLIVVECDSEMNEDMKAVKTVITGMIANVKSEKRKLIIVTSGETNWLPANEYPPLECGVDSTFLFENLDESSKKVISQCHVEMHGKTIMLGKSDSLCSQYLLQDVACFFNLTNSSDIIDILDGKIIDISGGSLPIMAQHYVDRTLFPITLDVQKLIYNLNDFSDLIIVSNSDTSIKVLFPDIIPLFEKGLIHEPPDGEYTKQCFLNDCATKFIARNVHWFRKEGSMFVWQISNDRPCFDYLVNDKGGIPESDLHELQNNFIILADEPGMGKSAAITKLFLEYRNMQFNLRDSHFNWPVYINLNSHQVELKNTTYTADAALSFLTKTTKLDCDFEKSVFKFCLERIGNFTFFIDSFDEISQKGQDFIVQMLQDLKNTKLPGLRIFIATRNYAKFELEKRLGTKSYQFHRVKYEAQIKFLVNYWTHNVPAEQRYCNAYVENYAEIFAKRAIEEIRNVLGEENTFIGIPLQLVLLALVYNGKFIQSFENTLRDGAEANELYVADVDYEMTSDKFSSTLELYDLYVNEKLDSWLEDKFQFETRTDWMDETLKCRMNEIHCRAALLYVSSSILTNSELNIQPLSPADSCEVNRVGFCETCESNFRFYHQTLAEYFTAKYLVNLIRNDHKNNVVRFMKAHYHKPYFKKIRYFLDSLLCTDIPVLENLEHFRKYSGHECEALRTHLTNGVWGGVDALERNVLHYAMAYGDHDSGIFWMIEKDLSLFHKIDLLGETCLSYLSLSENFPYLFPGDFSENRNYTILATQEDRLLVWVLRMPVLYSIFCGLDFQIWLNKYFINETRSNTPTDDTSCDLSDARKQRLLPDDVFGNSELFVDFIWTKDQSLLTQKAQINMTWFTHLTVDRKTQISDLLSRLCLHNSLDQKAELLYLKDWFQTCLSDDGDCSFLGAELIHICLGIQKFEYYVLNILRNNFPKYYHNVFPYMHEYDEYVLWDNCSDIEDKKKMLLVMRNYNFYSLFRVQQCRRVGLLEELVQFVYNECDEFKDALNKGLAKTFLISIHMGWAEEAFGVFCVSDEQTRKQMIQQNFVFHSDSDVYDEPELSVVSEQTFKDIIRGKNKLWTLRSQRKINYIDFQSEFFTLPVLAEYE